MSNRHCRTVDIEEYPLATSPEILSNRAKRQVSGAKQRTLTTVLQGGVFLTVASCSVPSVGFPLTEPHEVEIIAPFEGVTLAGRVLDPDGVTVADAYVVVTPHGYEATSSQDGAFRVPNLPAGEYVVMASADGWDPGRAEGVVVAAGEEVALDVSLQRVTTSGTMNVQVYQPNGLPQEGAIVTASSGPTAITDADGLATLSGLGGTTVSVEIESGDLSLWSRHVDDIHVVAGGGAQVAVTLAGRSPDDARLVGSTFCAYCHTDIAAAWSETGHGASIGTTPDPALVARFAAEEEVDLGAATAALSLNVGTPTVTLRANDGEVRSYPVTAYIGDTRRGTVPMTELGGMLWALPVGWVRADDRRPGFSDAAERLVPGDTDGWLDAGGNYIFSRSSTPSSTFSAQARCLPCHTSGSTLNPR
ncbi:MAG: hypothetical protein ACI9MC_001544, partial [Kiritimatiellia bacterium]